MVESPIPVVGFVAYSGTGKTTLIKSLIPLLRDREVRVGVIKHAHHGFDIDTPGKDSYELREAGAVEMLVASAKRWALLVDTPKNEDDPDLQQMLNRLNLEELDLVIVEGFKSAGYPKIELHRPSQEKPLLFPEDKEIIAVATDTILEEETELPVLDINDAHGVTDFIVHNFLS